MKYHFPLFGLFLLAGCDSPATTTAPAAVPAAEQRLHQAIGAYIAGHGSEFPGYEPVYWRPPTTYTKATEAALKGLVAMQAFDDGLTPRNQALADYKASVARHDAPATAQALKARYTRANHYNDSLLALANRYTGITDTARIGTGIVHAYRLKSPLGFVALDSATFVVYENGEVEQL